MTCTQLDAFFDGELASADADAFRSHLATCDRCQAQLRGRMQEALVVEEAAPGARVIPIARARRRYIAAVTAVAAAAATVLIVWTLRSPAPVRVAVAEPSLEVSVTKRGAVVRGTTAQVGDRVTIATHGIVWVYFDEHELVQTCSESCTIDLARIGTYTVVAVTPGAVAPIAGRGLDEDLAAALVTGARHRLDTIHVDPGSGNVP